MYRGKDKRNDPSKRRKDEIGGGEQATETIQRLQAKGQKRWSGKDGKIGLVKRKTDFTYHLIYRTRYQIIDTISGSAMADLDFIFHIKVINLCYIN